jgi:glutaredoxin
MTKKYTVYGIDNCPFCDNAVSLLNARKIEFDYKKVPDDIAQEDVGKELGLPMRTAPFITYFNGEKEVYVGGFQQLAPFVNKNR